MPQFDSAYICSATPKQNLELNHEEVKQHRGWFEKETLLTKKRVFSSANFKDSKWIVEFPISKYAFILPQACNFINPIWHEVF